ncbi:hypothetical protein FIU97_10960 [Roseivivax sp. THAF40]|uniref:hypothetical protein n=1 Tax=unclassified Roseivivax TaxID=2639302 RepID=UPI001268D170|nr:MULTISPECIES: hypothetical protein [unclassified Roseivivax]QFS83349.1 hypothetical protein FIV09_10975 [Roseivivax sp. THAF197b]QFT47093.1 hypothetical protein FIU97_10960 [Roseivivax sp. THAF40]
MFRSMILALWAAIAVPAAAQVSLDELDAAADATDTAMEEFRKRLNDPDPDRALAVLHLLVSKGDADQRRMAVRHGLQSTDRAIRATTLRAIFDSDPTLRIVFDPVSEEPDGYFARDVNNAGGVIDADGNGSVTFKITGYDGENECWTYTRSNYCLVRMRGDAVSLSFGGSWGAYELNGSGQLVGEQSIQRNLARGTIDLSE